MKILVTPTSFLFPENEAARTLLEQFADDVVYSSLKRPLTSDEIANHWEGVDGYLAGLDQINAGVLEKAPDTLRVISRYGIGVDCVDLQAAGKRGIVVTNTPGTNSVAVAELAFALMLGCARNLVRLHNNVEGGGWLRHQGVELYQKTLGIIGLGAIGKNLAIRARGFGMNVKAYDLFADEQFNNTHQITMCGVEEIISTCDFISLHVPLNDKTYHLIDQSAMKKIKRGAVLINTARGGLVDEEAAAAALRSGQLGGLGMDAFEKEPLTDSPLKGLENVIFTPHTGAHTKEAISAMGMLAVKNLITVLKGEPCPYIVNREVQK